MNLNSLFNMQKELDERILDRFPELRNEDLLDKKILALQVELGELAQNWRGFKFWSEDLEPRTEHECDICEGEGSITLLTESINDGEGEKITFFYCKYCDGDGYLDKNPLLEEYVDGIHFFLSIGLEIGYQDVKPYEMNTSNDITTEFNLIKANISGMWLSSFTSDGRERQMKEDYRKAFSIYISLGKSLGFTWEQIETAYMAKNKTNHERQLSGY